VRLTFTALVLAVVALPAAAGAQIPQQEYAARRAKLAQAVEGDGVVLALGAREPEHDYLSFYQSPSFEYLTGYPEPDAMLVMVKRGGQVTQTLYVQPKNPAQEVWTGNRFGPEGATRKTGIPAREAMALRPALDSLLASGLRLHVVGNFEGDEFRSVDQQWVAALGDAARNARDLTAVVSQMRGTKTPAELEGIRKAVAITVDAHRQAAAAIEPGMNEFEIQALIEYTFRRNGADRPGFASIVGSGPNSTTLHYNRNDRFMEASDVVVIDIGASYRGYTADVTRTYPVRGTFSPAQRDIYQIVRDAQAAAERNAKPGMAARAMSDSASATLAAGLARIGLIEGADATYDCGANGARQCRQLQLYYMHGLGHGIGLEVHDPEQYYVSGTIAEGSAFTLEPGIYVRPNTLDIIPDSPRNRAFRDRIRAALEKYRGIGVRIEDDYIVTAQGLEWISRAPREIAEVEAAMKQPATVGAPRDAAKVGWYRKP
jgi:Xaa-Pro aminopeptidase